MSRENLQDLLARYDSVIASPGYSNELKRDALRSADLIRTRLERGDFRVGDRIVLKVEGEAQGAIPDTLMVQDGPAITIPAMGRISLAGILRSELEDHLTREIGRYIRQPEITASSLIRISVQGAVGRPGFYVFPSDLLLGDVLMRAGGPGAQSDLEDIRVRRGDELIMEGGEMQTALDEGRSLDQLGLQAGDEITVGLEEQSSVWPQIFRYAMIISSSLFLGIRIF
ncbi:MAG: SLBB domain-containing protein [Gemmatimonadota bacterium]|jgi:protein involved in polysaccharide export with SLBB domain